MNQYETIEVGISTEKCAIDATFEAEYFREYAGKNYANIEEYTVHIKLKFQYAHEIDLMNNNVNRELSYNDLSDADFTELYEQAMQEAERLAERLDWSDYA